MRPSVVIPLLLLLAVTLTLGASLALLRKTTDRLGRWERPHIAQRPAQGGPGPRVAFVGASITEAWPLAEMLPEYETINCGQGWSMAGQELLRYRAQVLERDVQAVVIKACAINFARPARGLLPPIDRDRVRDAMAMMAQLARARGAQVVLCTPVPVAESYAKAHGHERLQEEVLALRDWVVEHCAAEGYAVGDYFGMLSDERGYLDPRFARDDIHVNRAGYERMTEAVRPALRAALGGEDGK